MSSPILLKIFKYLAKDYTCIAGNATHLKLLILIHNAVQFSVKVLSVYIPHITSKKNFFVCLPLFIDSIKEKRKDVFQMIPN